ncbi:hypothetical protein C161_06206 [Paenibacillus sp. FSL R5-192]|uniref:DUF2975 domain-containing protein n=2 Tax=Bacillales TaxID=1385 RepID=UPI0003E1F0A3|nr:DUF2975 domain-containing protein [Paenibacillus sp. FSL R5-192]ETT38658.1 hypothetical protein C161_06206 [Paenibacillus sp. FSL R5-192]
MRRHKHNRAPNKRHSGIKEAESELSFSNRATRLVIVLTVMGTILGVGLKVYFNIFVSFFSSSIYLELYIRQKHILILCIGSYITCIVLHLVLYVVAEFQSFNIIPTEYMKNQTKLKKSVKRYDEIFKSLIIYFVIAILIFVSYFLIEAIYFKNRIVIIASVIFVLVFVLAALVSFLISKRKSLDWIITLKKIPYKHVGFFLISLFIWFLVGAASMFQEGPVNVEIQNDLIVIESEMTVPRNVEISFLHRNNKKQMETIKTIKVIKEDFNVSFQETISDDNPGNDFFTKLSKLPPESRKSIQIKNSKYRYMYQTSITDYFKEGQNYIILSFSRDSFVGETNTKIVIPALLEKGEIKAQQNEFHVK